MNKYIPLLVLAMLLLAATPSLAYIDLGVAGEYNAFVFNDFIQSNSDVQGDVAAGGDVVMTSNSVGGGMVVGGDLTFTNGSVGGDVLVGGTSNLSSFGSGSYAVTDGATLPFDFEEQRLYLEALSVTLGGYAATGTDILSGTTLTLTGDNSSMLQVFNLDGAELLFSNTLSLSGVLEGSTILINVSGAESGLVNIGLDDLSAYNTNILFNFYEAEDLYLDSVGVQGSILAPFADVTGYWYGSGSMDGTLIASSYDAHIELHDNPFESRTPVPEPGTFLLLGGGLLGVAFVARRRTRRTQA